MKLGKNLITKFVAVFLLFAIFTGSIVYLKLCEEVSAKSSQIKISLKSINDGTGVEITLDNCKAFEDIQLLISKTENDYSKYLYSNGEYFREIKNFWNNTKKTITYTINGLPQGNYTFFVYGEGEEDYCKCEESITIKAAKSDNNSSERAYDFSDAKQGDIIKFGSYEQDDNMVNGKEDIEWIVLSKEDEKLFVLSKYVLDSLSYEKIDSEYDDVTTWEESPLRSWLNTEFYNNAFTDSEKSMIISTNVKNNAYRKNGMPDGKDTVDNVFLLSVSEVNDPKYGFGPIYDLNTNEDSYSSDDENGLRKSENTAFASVQNADSFWWLRSVGDRSLAEYEDGSEADVVFKGTAYVGNDGTIVTYGIRDYECNFFDPDSYSGYDFGGVRPAMYIKVKSSSGSGKVQNETLAAASKYTIQDKNGKYLSYKKVDGVNVITVSKKKTYWIIKPTDDGRYIFSPKKNKKLRIDIDNAWDVEGNTLKLYPNSGYVDAQTWYLDKNKDNTYCIRTSYTSGRLIAYSKTEKRCILSGNKKLSHNWTITAVE